MGTIKDFEDIQVWQKARELSRAVYRVSNTGLFGRDFGLRDQIRRAAVSTLSNIAEGFERSGNGEFSQFLSMAKGSVGEVRAQLYVALDQGYLAQEEFERLSTLCREIGKMIGGMMAYLRSSEIKGVKFK